MKCYKIMKIIPQAFHRVQARQNRNPEWKDISKIGCAENRAWDDPTVKFLWAPDDMVVPSDECVSSSYAFSGNIQRGIRAEKATTGWTDWTDVLKKCSKAQDFFIIL
jgi:hypothetical protein